MSALLVGAFFVLVCFVVLAFALHNAEMDAERDRRER